jgi:hypothetical protein
MGVLRRSIITTAAALAGLFQVSMLWILVVVIMDLINPCAADPDMNLPPGCTSGPIRSDSEFGLLIFGPLWLTGTFLTLALWRWWRRGNSSISPAPSKQREDYN